MALTRKCRVELIGACPLFRGLDGRGPDVAAAVPQVVAGRLREVATGRRT